MIDCQFEALGPFIFRVRIQRDPVLSRESEDLRALLHGYLPKPLRRSPDKSTSYNTSHSESTKELANPPKNGTSKRSNPSAVRVSVSL